MSSEKSVVVSSFGDCQSLLVMGFPLPTLDPEFVEVEVHFSGMNFADLYMIKGFLRQEVPFVLGIECSGLVKARGSNVTTIKLNQRVICYDYNGGMCSDRIRVNWRKCYPFPDEFPFHIACSLFVSYTTAYYSINKLGNLKDDDIILIKSCAGGVGWAATQLAKMRKNIYICGTVSLGKEEPVLENGVNEILDLNNTDIAFKFDVILDNEAGESVQQAMNMLNCMGRLIILGANNFVEANSQPVDDEILRQWGQGTHNLIPLVLKSASVCGLHLGLLAEEKRDDLMKVWGQIIEYYKNGLIKPRIDSIFAIDEVVAAMAKLRDRKNVGKVLLSFNR